MTANIIIVYIFLGQLGFMSNSPEEAFLNRVHPVPAHIDMEELLERLEPIEAYLPTTVAELKTYLWGHETDHYSEESGLIVLAGFKNSQTPNMILIGNILTNILFYTNELLTIEEDNRDSMTQQQFYQLVNTVTTKLNLDVSIGINDCIINTWDFTRDFGK